MKSFGWLYKCSVPCLFMMGMMTCFQGCNSIPLQPTDHSQPQSSGHEPSPVPGTETQTLHRFARNSPFEKDYQSPLAGEKKKLWARSVLWDKAPELVVETWLTGKPDLRGKYVLVEFWATWCPHCIESIPLLNTLHNRFHKKLAVIAITDEKEDTVRRFRTKKIDYFIAIDTQGRMKKELGVFGIPHVILVEPGGYVVWEGYPLLKGHELTKALVEKILNVKP